MTGPLEASVTDQDSWASSPAVRNVMLGNRKRDTKPELAVRRAVHRRGLRYTVAARPLPQLARTADLVFRGAKVAVFVDGCFWHGCPAHYKPPRSNSTYWLPKIQRNQARDRSVDEALRGAGWGVIRFWEHEDPEKVAAAIAKAVQRRKR
ncbi:MAG: very short patch repair endonuclease [Acidimicrobiales bacterium]